MHSFGLTCPSREKIEQDGAEKYKYEYLARLIREHEVTCERCKKDYGNLYATGMLNGKRPDFIDS